MQVTAQVRRKAQSRFTIPFTITCSTRDHKHQGRTYTPLPPLRLLPNTNAAQVSEWIESAPCPPLKKGHNARLPADAMLSLPKCQRHATLIKPVLLKSLMQMVQNEGISEETLYVQ